MRFYIAQCCRLVAHVPQVCAVTLAHYSLAPFGKPFALIGGLHGFSDFQAISNLAVICPAHCTKHTSKIQSLYPDKYTPGGAGKVITF
jgi:metal-dependent hydrolase (beta-lactamase superfamily II)